MKKEDLFDILGEIDEQKVAIAGVDNTCKKHNRTWIKWGVTVACLCCVISFGIWIKIAFTPSHATDHNQKHAQ